MGVARLVLLCASLLICASASSLTKVTARTAYYKSCGYHGEMVKWFPLYAGNYISRVGATRIKVNDKHVSLTFFVSNPCKIKKWSKIRVMVRDRQPWRVQSKWFPCTATSYGHGKQTVTCPLSKFKFKCCNDLHFYTHLTLQCYRKTKWAFTGQNGCAGKNRWSWNSRWCNHAKIWPPCGKFGCNRNKDRCNGNNNRCPYPKKLCNNPRYYCNTDAKVCSKKECVWKKKCGNDTCSPYKWVCSKSQCRSKIVCGKGSCNAGQKVCYTAQCGVPTHVCGKNSCNANMKVCKVSDCKQKKKCPADSCNPSLNTCDLAKCNTGKVKCGPNTCNAGDFVCDKSKCTAKKQCPADSCKPKLKTCDLTECDTGKVKCGPNSCNPDQLVCDKSKCTAKKQCPADSCKPNLKTCDLTECDTGKEKCGPDTCNVGEQVCDVSKCTAKKQCPADSCKPDLKTCDLTECDTGKVPCGPETCNVGEQVCDVSKCKEKQQCPKDATKSVCDLVEDCCPECPNCYKRIAGTKTCGCELDTSTSTDCDPCANNAKGTTGDKICDDFTRPLIGNDRYKCCPKTSQCKKSTLPDRLGVALDQRTFICSQNCGNPCDELDGDNNGPCTLGSAPITLVSKADSGMKSFDGAVDLCSDGALPI